MPGGRYFLAGAAVMLAAACILPPVIGLDSPSLAADPAMSFEELFGADAKKASTSRNTKDAADFAVKLLENAQKVGDDPALREFMLNKVCEFAMKDPSGFATAVQAAETLAAEFAAKKDFYADKLLGLYQVQYEKAKTSEKAAAGEEYANMLLARGDELLEPGQPASSPASGPISQPAGPRINVEAINAAIKFYKQAQIVTSAIRSPLAAQVAQKISDAAALIDLKKRHDELAARYAAKPDDAATAKAMALLCLLELDDPALASKYSSAGGDEGLKIYVPLAAKPVGDVQESLCMELANWYKALAAGSSNKQAKINALSRCKSYVTQFIALHNKADGDQLKAQKMLDETGAELSKLDPAGTGGTSPNAARLNLPQKTGIIWKYEGPATLVYRLLLSPDRKKLVMHHKGGYSIFDVETRKEIFKCSNSAFGEGFTADSKIFMLACNPLQVFEIKTGKPLVQKSGHSMTNHHPCFSPDGKFVFGFIDRPKNLDVLDVQTGKKAKEIPLGTKGEVTDDPCVALSPDGKLAIVGGNDEGEPEGKRRFCKIFDLATEKITQNLPCLQETDFGGFYVSFLADGKRAMGYKQRTGIMIWDVRTGKVLWELKTGKHYALSLDGRRVAITDYHNIEIIDVASGKQLHRFTPEKSAGEDFNLPGIMCFTPDGQYLFCGYNYHKDRELKSCGAFLVGIGQ